MLAIPEHIRVDRALDAEIAEKVMRWERDTRGGFLTWYDPHTGGAHHSPPAFSASLLNDYDVLCFVRRHWNAAMYAAFAYELKRLWMARHRALVSQGVFTPVSQLSLCGLYFAGDYGRAALAALAALAVVEGEDC